MKKIMLATDFSDRSERALRRAALLAQQTGAQLLIVHAVDDDQPAHLVESERELALGLLTDLRDNLGRSEGLDVAVRVLLGDAFEALRQATEAERPDLLVIGAHRRRLLLDIFIGTTAERTIRSVGCPVLMVNAAPLGPYANILLTSDLSDASRHALQKVGQIGIGETARKVILHVFNVPALNLAMGHTLPPEGRKTLIDSAEEQARRTLSGIVSGAGLRQVRLIVRFETGPVAQLVQTTAAEERSDLVVLSTRGLGAVPRALLGSVTEQVLRASAIDVLAIPPQSPA